ncbi:hypothetical protein RND71_019575 [Anisodus tanguticus]|uniref:Uncharacterized protein n=1 Tax=Anisodus tanguticus TaxID=243964 RepID=A0AAE1V8K9_9SOLA|nr:hypothetical protein RND71_019575 [Anisodus tanguticus]
MSMFGLCLGGSRSVLGIGWRFLDVYFTANVWCPPRRNQHPLWRVHLGGRLARQSGSQRNGKYRIGSDVVRYEVSSDLRYGKGFSTAAGTLTWRTPPSLDALDTFFSCSQRHLLSDIRFEALDEIKVLWGCRHRCSLLHCLQKRLRKKFTKGRTLKIVPRNRRSKFEGRFAPPFFSQIIIAVIVREDIPLHKSSSPSTSLGEPIVRSELWKKKFP